MLIFVASWVLEAMDYLHMQHKHQSQGVHLILRANTCLWQAGQCINLAGDAVVSSSVLFVAAQEGTLTLSPSVIQSQRLLIFLPIF